MQQSGLSETSTVGIPAGARIEIAMRCRIADSSVSVSRAVNRIKGLLGEKAVCYRPRGVPRNPACSLL